MSFNGLINVSHFFFSLFLLKCCYLDLKFVSKVAKCQMHCSNTCIVCVSVRVCDCGIQEEVCVTVEYIRRCVCVCVCVCDCGIHL